MKNRLPIIILSIVLLISLGGNVYLIMNQSVASKQLAEVQNQLTDTNNQIKDYESLQSQIVDLQKQLSQKDEKILALENTIAELEKQLEDKALQEQIEREEKGEVYNPTPKEKEGSGKEVKIPEEAQGSIDWDSIEEITDPDVGSGESGLLEPGKYSNWVVH